MILNDINCAKSEIVTDYGIFEIIVIKHELSPMGDTIVMRHGEGNVLLV